MDSEHQSGGEPPVSTDAQRFARLEKHFNAAIALEGSARRAYVESACADAAERRELELLLAAAPDATARFAEVLPRALVETAAAADEALIGERIGPWRIVDQLGHGGMGTVYGAERADGAYTQRAAIKLIRGIGHSAELRARFVAERQILARLDHPGIARLLDGGEWRGVPWLAMERIDGQPIDVWCAGRPVRDCLQVFRQICDAVQYAHRNLVIHRDIKPSNILVDAAGKPHLLDFGIAKLLDEEAAGESVHTQLRMLTPEYASPEQLLGQPVTTACDVYSLGVLLYRMLTGAGMRMEGAELSPVERAVTAAMPMPPSRALLKSSPTPQLRQRASELQGDLDAIALKALRSDAGERYASVAALEEDIGRYLRLEPVQARREGAGYVLGRFVRRHRGSLAVAASVLMAVIGLVAYYTYRLEQSRNQATLAAQQALRAKADTDAVADFLIELFAEADPNQRKPDKSLRQVLEQGTERVTKDLASQPLVAARVQRALGQAWTGLGDYERAATVLADAQARYEVELGPLSEPALQARMDRARALSGWGHMEDAYALMRDAWAQIDMGTPSATALNVSVLLMLTNTWQTVAHDNGALLAVLDRARAMIETLDSSQRLKLTADEAQQRCRLLAEFRHDDDTLRACRRSVDLDRELHGEDDIIVGKDWVRLARATLDTGAVAVGREAEQKARAIYQQYYQPDNRNWSNLDYLKHALCITQGDYACAAAYSARAAKPVPAAASKAERTEYTRRFVSRTFLLGEARDPARADAALAILAVQPDAAFGGDPYMDAFEHDFIPYWVQLMLGRSAAALQHAEAYFEWVRQRLGETDENTARARLAVANAAMAQHPPQIERARVLSERAMHDASQEFLYPGPGRAEWLTLQARLNNDPAPALEALEIWRRCGIATGLTVRTLEAAADLLPPNDARVATFRAEAAAIVARARAAVEATSSGTDQ